MQETGQNPEEKEEIIGENSTNDSIIEQSKKEKRNESPNRGKDADRSGQPGQNFESQIENKLVWAENFIQGHLDQPIPPLKPPKKFVKTPKYRSSMRDIKSSQAHMINLAAVDKAMYGPIIRWAKRRRKSWSELVESWELSPRPILQVQPRRMSVLESLKQPELRQRVLVTRPKAKEEEIRTAEREDRLGQWGIKENETNLRLVGRPLQESDYQILCELLELDFEFNQLNLTRCFINTENAEALSQALTFNSALKTLVLQNTNIKDTGVKALAELLSKNEALSTFDCRSCKRLTGLSGQYLFEGIQGNTTLEMLNGIHLPTIQDNSTTSLNLRSLNLGEPEAALIGNLIRDKESLTSINFFNNGLNAASSRYLCEALQGLPAISEVTLNKNKITRHGLPYICRFIETSTSLKSLNLTRNELTDEGWNDGNVRAIGKSLLKNTQLIHMNLSGNWISDEVLSMIEDRIRVNRSLKHNPTVFWEFLHQKFNPQPSEGCLFDMNDASLLEKVDMRFLRKEKLSVKACDLSWGEYSDDFKFRTANIQDITPPRTRENSY